jgi:hypothetical protein
MRPRILKGPFAWSGDALSRSGHWIYELTATDISEIDVALGIASERGIAWVDLGRENFPLPALGPKLAAIGEELEEGSGIALLRGFPVERYADDALRLAFMGIGLHLGVPVYQNASGERMRAIRDEGPDRGERYGEVASGDGAFLSSRARVASTGELRFHTDRSDLVALLCVRPAKQGGLTRIASSVAVHNAMLARRPDLLECLYQPYPRSRFGEEAQDNDAFYPLPVVGVRDGKFTSHYSRTYIEAAQLNEAAPRLGDSQWEAIDTLAALAEELCIETQFEPGDLQFLNSHVTYHSRSAYEDDPGLGRLLYRLWLCPPNNRALPEDHEVLWRSVEAGGLRGGIGQSATINQ